MIPKNKTVYRTRIKRIIKHFLPEIDEYKRSFRAISTLPFDFLLFKLFGSRFTIIDIIDLNKNPNESTENHEIKTLVLLQNLCRPIGVTIWTPSLIPTDFEGITDKDLIDFLTRRRRLHKYNPSTYYPGGKKFSSHNKRMFIVDWKSPVQKQASP